MPINVNDPEYVKAERAYYESESKEEKLTALRKMISHAPKHKGGENLRQKLTQRRKKLEEEIEKTKKKGKGTKQGIKKGDMQVVLVGKTNSGKSSLMKILTNAKLKISSVPFTTKEPTVGILNYNETQIQIIEIPSIEGEDFEKGIVHTADTVVLIAKDFDEFEEIKKLLPIVLGKIVYCLNFSDLLTKKEKRKISAKMQSKKMKFTIISSLPHFDNEGVEELKKKIFETFKIIRVFTKEPGKAKTKRPIVLRPNSNVKDVAEKILKGFSKRVTETKIWGPSSKFSGQIVGLNHKLKDLDTVELKTK